MGKRNRMRVLLTLLLTVLTAATAAATDFITDVMLIGHDIEASINALKQDYVNQGWKVYPVDLNANAGGDYIYLLYKTETSTDNINYGDYITNFFIKQGAQDVNNALYHIGDGHIYYLVPYDGRQHFKDQKGDLNMGFYRFNGNAIPPRKVYMLLP